MTIQACHDYFDLLADKQEGLYFTDDWKDNFISQACIEYVKQHLPSVENGGVNFEVDQVSYNNLYTLIYTTGTTTMTTGGVVTISALQSLLNTASSSTEPFMAILGVNWTKSGKTLPVKWTRQNNWFKDIRNPFKVGDANEPIYKYDKVNMTFYPVDVNASLSFTLLKQPKTVDLGSGVGIELPEHTHKRVVEMAVDIAAITMRDQELRVLNS